MINQVTVVFAKWFQDKFSKRINVFYKKKNEFWNHSSKSLKNHCDTKDPTLYYSIKVNVNVC